MMKSYLERKKFIVPTILILCTLYQSLFKKWIFSLGLSLVRFITVDKSFVKSYTLKSVKAESLETEAKFQFRKYNYIVVATVKFRYSNQNFIIKQFFFMAITVQSTIKRVITKLIWNCKKYAVYYKFPTR